MMSNTVSFDDSIRLICVLLEYRINMLFGDLHRLTRRPMDLTRHLDASIQSKQGKLKAKQKKRRQMAFGYADGCVKHADGTTLIRTTVCMLRTARVSDWI